VIAYDLTCDGKVIPTTSFPNKKSDAINCEDLFGLVSLPCHYSPVKDIPQVGPLQWGRIKSRTSTSE
jgi:hypothetical protein